MVCSVTNSEAAAAVYDPSSQVLQKYLNFMRFCGVVKPAGYNDCVDYIDNELDFAGLLASRPDYLAQRGIDALAKLDEFIGSHLLLWVEGYCGDVATQSPDGYLAALCALTKEFMAVLR